MTQEDFELHGINWRYSITKAMIAHNNEKLQNTLKTLGYTPLDWTVCDDKRQKLIIDSSPGTCGRYPNEVHYEGCFWNGGITPIEKREEIGLRGDCYYCGDNEELFIHWAKKLMEEGEIFFDENKKELKDINYE